MSKRVSKGRTGGGGDEARSKWSSICLCGSISLIKQTNPSSNANLSFETGNTDRRKNEEKPGASGPLNVRTL